MRKPPQPEASPPLRIERIRLDGLFGHYHHDIPLMLADRVTLLHGPNGVGKTLTLSRIAALLEGDYEALCDVPFERLELAYVGGERLAVEQVPWPEGEDGEPWLDEDGDAVFYLRLMTPMGKALYCPQRWRSRAWQQTGVLSHEGITEQRGYTLSRQHLIAGWPSELSTPLYNGAVQEPVELTQLRARTPVHFVPASRLYLSTKAEIEAVYGYRTPDEPLVPRVLLVARELVEAVNDADSDYAARSLALDATLSRRIFSSPLPEPQPAEALANAAADVQRRQQRLRQLGLFDKLEPLEVDPIDFSDERRAMFSVVVDDWRQKLAAFDALAERLELLLEVLNRKLHPKRVTLDREAGYRAWDHTGAALDLEHLSSGEQHELVLLHTLLFDTPAGSLVLIDEPELSLHVRWQSDFLPDLLRITAMVRFDAVLATHSPYIVGDRDDLMVALRHPVP
ncbi:MAG: AAA family ATPase [Alphaproteobacteria bacterium]|nr:AAA family ATPase [Alphaproteobacteria bacterium]